MANALASVDVRGDVTRDFIPLLRQARREALKAQELERQAVESPEGIDWGLLAVSELFAELVNWTYKLVGGDSLVRIGHGIEGDKAFADSLAELLQQLGRFLVQALEPGSQPNDSEALKSYTRAIKAHFRAAHACESFLLQGDRRNT